MNKVDLSSLRISRAALGRHLVSFLLLAEEGNLAPEEVLPTMRAVFDHCLSDENNSEKDPGVNQQLFETAKTAVDKSAHRSEIARRAAKKRREARQNKVAEENEVANTLTAHQTSNAELDRQKEIDKATEPEDEPEVVDINDPWLDMSDEDYLLYSGKRRDGRPLTQEEKVALDVRRCVAKQLGRYPYRPDPNWCRDSRLLSATGW